MPNLACIWLYVATFAIGSPLFADQPGSWAPGEPGAVLFYEEAKATGLLMPRFRYWGDLPRDLIEFQSVARGCPSLNGLKNERDECLSKLPQEVVRRGQAAIRKLNGVDPDTDVVRLVMVPSTSLPPCDQASVCRSEVYYADCVEDHGFAVEDAALAPETCLHELTVSECGLIDYRPEFAQRVEGKPWLYLWDASWTWWVKTIVDECTNATRR